MELKLNYGAKETTESEVLVLSAYQKEAKKGKKSEMVAHVGHWPKELREKFENIKSKHHFTATQNEYFMFTAECGTTFQVLGLGEKAKLTAEGLRRVFAKFVKRHQKDFCSATVLLDQFVLKSKHDVTIHAITEGMLLANYNFDKHLSKKAVVKLESVTFDSKEKKTKQKPVERALDEAKKICESIYFQRDLVNDPPNVLHSESYAKRVVEDCKKLKGVKTKVLGKAELKKEKMGLFLSVNAGSAYDPKLVHLTYTPKKANSKTKHIAFVGKGLTFDTGGYSLKPAASIINMKFDMAGSATVYGAFRAAVLLELPVKITCILGMTDNAVNEKATMPDAIVKGRNGMSVEILNTDAEGRLVLADCLDYACDLKPDVVIDAATLTGACLVALGSEVCGVMGNDSKLTSKILKATKDTDEYAWELPIIDEWRNDMKSPIADLKNIGGSRFGGTAKAAAFLENFIKNDVSWAHLDIAGVGDSQSHLPYCPNKGASGAMVRSLVTYLKNV